MVARFGGNCTHCGAVHDHTESPFCDISTKVILAAVGNPDVSVVLVNPYVTPDKSRNFLDDLNGIACRVNAVGDEDRVEITFAPDTCMMFRAIRYVWHVYQRPAIIAFGNSKYTWPR